MFKNKFLFDIKFFLYNFTQLSKATFPKVTITFSFFKDNISLSKKLEQLEISLLKVYLLGYTFKYISYVSRF